MNFYIINATLTLDENIVLHEKQAKLEKEIAKLEKQARAEKQPKKKFIYYAPLKREHNLKLMLRALRIKKNRQQKRLKLFLFCPNMRRIFLMDLRLLSGGLEKRITVEIC